MSEDLGNKRQGENWDKWIADKDHATIIQKLKDLEYKATHDPMTDLLNKGSWTSALGEYSSLMDSENKSIAFVIADIDEFKFINDNYGHEVGDQALIFVSNVIKSLDRGSDIQARIGGDEFGILMPFTNLSGARSLRTRITERIQKSLNELEEGDILAEIDLKISIGVSERKPRENVVKSIKKADDNMYKIKRQRKNG